MENTMTTAAEQTRTEEIKAYELHGKIMSNIEAASNAIFDMCVNLKKMRDGNLFKVLGYEKFEDYTESALKIKGRQAYNYIQAYEQLGESFLQSNANLGVTKLSLLVKIPALERENFVEDNDLGSMSVSEMKKLVAENNQQAEQISMLTDELTDKDNVLVDKTKDLTAANEKIKQLTEELDRERSKPIEAAATEPDEEIIEKIRREEKQKYEKTLESEKSKIKKAVGSESEEQQKQLEEKIAVLESEKEQSEKLLEAQTEKHNSEIAELKKKSAVSERAAQANDETARFKVYFTEVQKLCSGMFDSVEKIREDDPVTADKCVNGILALIDSMTSAVEEMESTE